MMSAGFHKVNDPFYIPPNIKPYGYVPYFYPNVPHAKQRYEVLYRLLPSTFRFLEGSARSTERIYKSNKELLPTFGEAQANNYP